MSALLLLRLVAYLAVADGIGALLVGGLIGVLPALAVGAAILASWWHRGARERGAGHPALGWALVGVVGAALALNLRAVGLSVQDGLIHTLVLIIATRLIFSRGPRDLRDAGSLSFLLLAAAASATFSAGLLVVFAGYVLLAAWMLMLHHVVAESERADRPRGFEAGGAVARMGLGAAAATFAIAGLLFFLIPRIGQATWPFRSEGSRLVSGFSERLDLGAFGEIESDRSIVMRVYVGDEIREPDALPNLRWRGIALDSFDGRVWTASPAERRVVRRLPGEPFLLAVPRGRGFLVRQEIYLDQIGTDVVFAAPRALRLDLPAGAVIVDDMGTISVPAPGARLHYVVLSQLEAPPSPGRLAPAASRPLDGTAQRRYLELPTLSPRIARLARDVTQGSRDPYEAAGRLTRFLAANYRYSTSKRETRLDPLQEFLFGARAGNCEYFSAALAVMLRAIDVPARVVGGFQRGEWNPYGRYFMVRLSDAHAWVEAYVDGLGWVSLDPSPRAGADAGSGAGALSLYLDAARMRWYRYVVNWSLDDQRSMVSTVQRRAHDVRLALAWPAFGNGASWLAPAAIGATVGGAVVLRRLGRTARARASATRLPRFYARALRQLERRGLTPAPAETARQFAERAGVAAPGSAEAFARITRAYERVRFGTAELGPADVADVEQCLARLARR
jgi:hypothetical protein